MPSGAASLQALGSCLPCLRSDPSSSWCYCTTGDSRSMPEGLPPATAQLLPKSVPCYSDTAVNDMGQFISHSALAREKQLRAQQRHAEPLSPLAGAPSGLRRLGLCIRQRDSWSRHRQGSP